MSATELRVAEIKHTHWNSEVYEPSDDTFLLVDALQEHAPTWAKRRPRCVLELGSGSGYVITSAALLLRQLRPRLAAQVLAVDHSPAAAEATRRTLQAHQVSEVDVVVASLFGPLAERLKGSVDVLLFNPPYVPTPDDEVERGGIASAWAGGHRGRRVIDRVLPLLPELLSPKGELFMVTVTENDPKGIIAEMQPHGFQGRIAASRQADEETLSIVHLWRG
ncbi:hypothetical protein HYH03_005836 [Edaphochlamys debaryana]|uniref:Methyltransferase small domain-containing protein n=1 Tax=Edaphochlamys debaryana TaxID=47281 RepID=A0A835Y7L7_9CHLO|nr:hypothetical protein HYH03_005836 [Edaphochlamys debaryana]|eukprot:KAG2496238.1 hypothetical protein HYH03_005836 [Edaphochlamys debaryana]